MSYPEFIVTGDMTPEQRKVEKKRESYEAQAALVASGGWEWFRAECEARARSLELDILNITSYADPRVEDRARGQAAAFRAMPSIVEKAADRFRRAQEAADNASNEEQQR